MNAANRKPSKALDGSHRRPLAGLGFSSIDVSGHRFPQVS
jgi:hypothetical protein